MVLDILIANVGGAIAETVFTIWLKENPLTATIVEIVERRTENLLLARKIQRQFDSLGDDIALSLKPIFENYGSEDEKNPISYESIGRELNSAIKSAQITSALLTSLNHNPANLARYMRKYSTVPAFVFSEKEQSLYDRAIDCIAQYIIDLSANLPEFNKENFAQILERLDEVLLKLNRILDEFQHVNQAAHRNTDRLVAEFEEDYRKAIIRKLDKLDIFGIDVAREINRYNLSIAYVSLEVFHDDVEASIKHFTRKAEHHVSTFFEILAYQNLDHFDYGDADYGLASVDFASLSANFDYSLYDNDGNEWNGCGKLIVDGNGVPHIFAFQVADNSRYADTFNSIMNTLKFENLETQKYLSNERNKNSRTAYIYGPNFSIQVPSKFLGDANQTIVQSKLKYIPKKKQAIILYTFGYTFDTPFVDDKDDLDDEGYEPEYSFPFRTTSLNQNNYKISVEDALNNGSRIAIIGEAGGGKTTLLQWLAVTAANDDFDENLDSLKNTIPFFIALRNYRNNPPAIEDLIAHMEADIPSLKPERWVHKVINSGRGLILIDGLDEVMPTKRNAVLLWLEELINQYPKVRIIFTSRPAAYRQGWLANLKFKEFSLAPMEYSSIKLFVQYWHRAVLIDQNLENADNTRIVANRLLDKLSNNFALMRLATNPLLCAMICALHYDRRLQLPSDRSELYEACISGLTDRRDQERDVLNENSLPMRSQEKRAILNDLAYWALKNGYTSFEINEAKLRIALKLENMQTKDISVDSDLILKHLIERSGIIREPQLGTLDFVHRTFQEYMAAKLAALENDWGILENHIADYQWQETIILATGFANKVNASRLIGKILDKAKTAKEAKKYYLQLLAIACLDSAVEVLPEIRSRVEETLSQLIPPQNPTTHSYLAAAGELAVPYLSYNSTFQENEISASLTILALIGTRTALNKISEYLEDRRPQVVDTLHKIFSRIQADAIAASSLGDNLLNSLKYYISDNQFKISGQYLYALSGLDKKDLSAYIPTRIAKVHIYDYLPMNSFLFSILDSVRELTIDGELQEDGIITEFHLLQNVQLNVLKLDSRSNEDITESLNQIASCTDLTEIALRIHGRRMPNLSFLPRLPKLSALTILHRFSIEPHILEHLGYIDSLKYLHLSINYGADLELLSKLQNLETLALSFSRHHISENLLGIDALNHLKKIIINYRYDTEGFTSLAKELKKGMPWCTIELKQKG